MRREYLSLSSRTFPISFLFLKMRQPWLLFRLFLSFKTKITILKTNKCEKTSIQYPALGFELITFWLRVFSLNHYTRAPISYFKQIFLICVKVWLEKRDKGEILLFFRRKKWRLVQNFILLRRRRRRRIKIELLFQFKFLIKRLLTLALFLFNEISTYISQKVEKGRSK